MIKYDVYKKYDSNGTENLVVDKYSKNSSRNKTINNINEYKDIVNRFISQDFNVTVSGDNLILKNNSTIFHLKNYKTLLNCNYLKKLKNIIENKVDLKTLELQQTIRETQQKINNKNSIFKKVSKRVIAACSAISIAIGIYAGMNELSRENHNDNSDDDNSLSFNNKISNEENNKILVQEFMAYSGTDENETTTYCNDNNKMRFSKNRLYLNERSIYDEQSIDDTTEQNKEVIDLELLRQKEYDKYISIFSKYYHFDSEKVKGFAREITENYTIPLNKIIGETCCDISTPEGMAIVFCSNLYANKFKSYGYDVNSFTINNNIQVMNESLTLSNGLAFTQFYGYVCDILGCDKYYALAICYLESGRLKSQNTFTKNNFGGIIGTSGYANFPTPEAGIIAHIKLLKEYESKGFNSLEQLSAYYVNGVNIKKMDPDKANSHIAHSWVKNVSSIRNEILRTQDKLFLNIEDVKIVLEEEYEDINKDQESTNEKEQQKILSLKH